MSGQCADLKPFGAGVDRVEAAEAIDVDEQRRPNEPERHRRQQALPARDQLRFAFGLGERVDRLLRGFCECVVEAGKLHSCAASSRCAARTACTIGV